MSRTGLNEGGVVTFTAAVAIAQYARVKLAASQSSSPADVDLAILDGQHIGYADRPAGIGEVVPVRLRNAEGTRLVIASEAFVAGAAVYGAAAGEVSGTAGAGTQIGVALQAAGAAGDIVSILDDNAGYA